MHRQALKNLCREIEQNLAKFYSFEPLATVGDHIFFSDESLSSDDNPSSLAETVFSRNGDELLISVRFSSHLERIFANEPSPLVGLSHRNLNAFAICTEEISHFHYLIDNAISETQSSRCELEIQGEFDKFIAAALTLQTQTGQPHMHALARLLFDHGKAYRDRELYDRAEAIAASWWWDHINAYGERLWLESEFHKTLRQIRGLRGNRKMRILASRPLITKKTA